MKELNEMEIGYISGAANELSPKTLEFDFDKLVGVMPTVPPKDCIFWRPVTQGALEGRPGIPPSWWR
ncbi:MULTISPECIES: hypothetical protein [Pseudomonas]|uniref:hypothetical protein n=1 Tax=Pseudomonas TaxID=286 RepID=UPI0011DD1182|nr:MULTISPECIES: hypothetical protein [Pseudomonas]